MRIGELGVGEKALVGEAGQEIQQILPLLRSQSEALDEGTLAGMRDALASAAGSIEVDDVAERRETAVVHVRRAALDVAQRRRLEAILVGSLSSHREQAVVDAAHESLAVRVQTRDVERTLHDGCTLVRDELA